MIAHAIGIAFVCVGLALAMNMWRLATGPTTMDRVLALDTMTINAIAAIVLLGIQDGRTLYFEAAMLFAMVGFVATVAYCKFLLRGGIIE